jgi:hypothetical protein
MILYNWPQILRHAEKSALKIITIVDYITYKGVPNHKCDPEYKYSQIDWSGSSFLYRPEPLLRLRYGGNRFDLDIAHYIGLASLRNYSEFKTTGKLSLDLLACIGKEDIINHNSLLYIEKDEVHFKYEEAH